MALQPMGIGALGFNNTVFKRKFRYTFEVQNICGGGSFVPAAFVKTAARPKLAIDETEINFLNAKMFIPGKATWDAITVTYIDAVNSTNVSLFAPLWSWLASVYNFQEPVELPMGSIRRDYAATGIIGMYDGCGTLLETWQLNNLWPTEIDFGELDYSSSDEATISLTLRYSDVIYTPICPGFTIAPCCSPCGK